MRKTKLIMILLLVTSCIYGEGFETHYRDKQGNYLERRCVHKYNTGLTSCYLNQECLEECSRTI